MNSTTKNIKTLWEEIIYGIADADALGVPVEFKSKAHMKKNPINDMIGYGTYNLPPGTWSDDTALSLCLAEAMTKDGDLTKNTADLFVQWLYANHWTPRGTVFDVGNTTRESISRYRRTNCLPELAGGMEPDDNGNGSLMRILPLLMFIKDKPVSERYEWTKKISSITHGHIRSVIACFYYLEYARLILFGAGKFNAYKSLQMILPGYLLNIQGVSENEIAQFNKLLKEDITLYTEEQIFGNGYVVNSLEAAMWCFLTTHTGYKDTVLKAVNLGEDTDTTAAIVGGLAGLHEGISDIPREWINQLARKDDIDKLISTLSTVKRFKYTPEQIDSLQPNEVFIFGSNKQGEHYGGAAAYAYKHFGAIWGQGEGLFGQSYAFPTLDRASTVTGKGPLLEVLSDEDLELSFKLMFDTVELYYEKEFLLTKVGTGIAGIPIEKMKALFNKFYIAEKHKNLTFPIEFKADEV